MPCPSAPPQSNPLLPLPSRARSARVAHTRLDARSVVGGTAVSEVRCGCREFSTIATACRNPAKVWCGRSTTWGRARLGNVTITGGRRHLGANPTVVGLQKHFALAFAPGKVKRVKESRENFPGTPEPESVDPVRGKEPAAERRAQDLWTVAPRPAAQNPPLSRSRPRGVSCCW